MRTRIALLAMILAASALPVFGGGYNPNPNSNPANEPGNGLTPDLDTKYTEAVYGLKGSQKGSYMGLQCLVLDVVNAVNGQTVLVNVPNSPPAGPYNPAPQALNVLKDGKPGDFFKIKTWTMGSYVILRQIEPYDLKPGETAANAFVFVDSKDDNGSLLVDVTRFDVPAALVVPTKKDASGKPAPDPAIAAVVASLKAGDVVLVTARPTGEVAIITTFEVWVAPSTGKFSKLTDTDVNGEKHPAIIVSDGGSDVTIQLPGVEKNGKWIVDAKILGAVKRLKPDQAVEYHTTKDGDTDVLKDIVPAPKPPTPAQ